MKRIALIFTTVLLCVSSAVAQTSTDGKTEGDKSPYSIKVQPFSGTYLDQNSHFNKFREMGPFAPTGINFGLEFPSQQQRPWQQYLNNPTLGIGMSVIDFGNEMVGGSVAVYPYLLIPAIRSKYLELNFKIASGLGYVTEHWYTGNVDPDNYDYYGDDVNTIFGCYINAYLNAGASVNIPISRHFSLNGEFGYFHMSNGRTCMPNIGANVIYKGVGVVANFNTDYKKAPVKFEDLPYKWSINVTGSLGAHRAWMYYPRYLISSLHTGAVYSVNNWYGLGLGLDAFYNGSVNSGTGRGLYCQGTFEESDGVEGDCNTCDGNYSLADKIRAGVSLNNEFRFGQVTAIVDWGVYFLNPSRKLYKDYHISTQADGGCTDRELFYKSSGAGNEEAFHYIRFGMKCRVWDNMYLQASAKTHLHICEFVEFGVGYQIPYLRKDKRKEGQSKIYHHGRN